MNLLAGLFWLILMTTVQGLFPTWHRMANTEFPFLLAVVLYVALNKRGIYLIVTAILAGILMDSMSLARFGVSICSMLAAGGLAMLLQHEFYDDKVPSIMFFGALCPPVSTLVTAWLLRAAGWTIPWAVIGWRMLGSCILGAVLVPIVFGLIRVFEIRLGTFDPEEDF